MRFLSFILVVSCIGFVGRAWSDPPAASPPAAFPLRVNQPVAAQGTVVPAAASSRDPLPAAGNAFPVRLPPVGYQPLPGLPMNPSFQPAAPARPPVQSPRQVFAAAQGIAVTERVAHALPDNPHNAHYLATKRDRSGHLL